jgi:ABC-2 type transport system permease protein
MKSMVFASRNSKELLRDPLNLAFSIGFPLAVLFLFYIIGASVPESIFEIETMAPGVAVFGLSFIALFSGTLISKDRTSSFLMRLFTTPLSASNYIVGYILPLLPMAIAQSAVCFIVSIFLGLKPGINILLAIVVIIPAAALFIGIGLLAGSILNDKQVGGLCGALLTNLSAWLSGAWFDLSLIGGTFERVAYLLPFAHAVDAARAAIAGDYAAILPHLLWVIGYAVIILAIAIVVFKKKMSSDKV